MGLLIPLIQKNKKQKQKQNKKKKQKKTVALYLTSQRRLNDARVSKNRILLIFAENMLILPTIQRICDFYFI